MSENKNLGHNSKKDFLKNPVEHIDITSFDSRTIITALLHDVVEDTKYSIDDIERLFGETVARIVSGLTKISNLKKEKVEVTDIKPAANRIEELFLNVVKK